MAENFARIVASKGNKNKGLEQFYFDKPGCETYHTAPMSGALPEYLDLTRISSRPVELSGLLDLAKLRRLAEVMSGSAGGASVALRIYHDGGQTVVQGRIQANLMFSCQRCFGAMDFPVKADFKLAWVRFEEEASRLPEAYEPLVSASGRVKLADIVEDELLLALPMVPLHGPLAACHQKDSLQDKERDISAARAKPFAALEALKRR